MNNPVAAAGAAANAKSAVAKRAVKPDERYGLGQKNSEGVPENIVPDSESMTMAISRRQAIIAASFEVLAVIMLLASGAFFLFWNELFHRDQNSTNSHDSVFTLIAAVIQWMGALWTAYACGAGVMIYPLLQDCNRMRSFYINNNNNQRRQQQSSTTMHSMFALHCSRAAAVSTAAFSLCTIVGSVLLLPEESSSSSSLSDDDAFLILIVQRLKFWMPCLGMGILSLSSASLMTSFWPSPSQPLEVDAPSRVEEYESLLLPPFLESQPPQQQRQQSSADDDALVRNHGRDDEEMDHYQLLEDGVAMPAATPSTFSNDKDANDKALAASNSCSSDSPVVENSSDTAPSNSSRLRGTRRLLQLAAPQVLYLYAGCAVLLCRLPFSLAMPHFVSTALAAVASGDFRTAHHQVQWLLLSGIVDAALDFWGFFLFGYANQKIVRSLRVDLFRRLLGQEMAFFDVHSSGELTSRLNSDCSEMAGDLTWFFRFSIESVVRITGITAYMLIRSPVLGACALSIIPAVAVINKFYGDWLRHNAVKVQDSLAEANSVAQEALANVRTVIAFVAEHKECQRYESRIERQYQLNIKQLYMTALYYMVVSTFLINTIVQGALLWIGTLLIEQSKLTPGVLLAFMLYQSQLQNETLSLMNSYTSLIKSSGAGDKVFGLLDRLPPPPSTGHALAAANTATYRTSQQILEPSVVHEDELSITPTPDDGDDEQHCLLAVQRRRRAHHQYNISLEHVSFVYPSRPENPVLIDLNLEIPMGKTVALVGKSGCGKSTIASLLQRYYDPTGGRVLINGVDLRQMDLLNHRRNIGVVTQDPVLFRGTLRENIVYGCMDTVPTNADVDRASRLAYCDTFIREFPDGYDTAVGERGVQLSGGQRQRIAIARAVIMQPSLLILDEATSSLDSCSEIAVQEALDQLMRMHENNTTVVVIAHRLRTVRNADKIVVLEGGKVVEEGTHDELFLRSKGVYRKMVEQAEATGFLPES